MSDDLHVVDLFAGGGGISTGAAGAARNLGYTPGEDFHLAAINHSEDAIETHAANHPWADHYHAKVEALHPPDVAPPNEVDLLTGGPSCTDFSKAKGGQPVKEQERASPWHVLRWVELLRPKHLLIENVGSLRTWGPVVDGQPTRDGSIYQRWIDMLQALGYTVVRDEKERYGVKLRAADFGDPTTRERLFVIASRTKRPTPPAPTHSDDPDDDLEDWVPASEIIDWSDRGESLFTRSRPLKTKTLDRIAVGIRDYCNDFLEPFSRVLEGFGRDDIRALQEDVVEVGELPEALENRDEPFLVRGQLRAGSESSTPLVMGQHSGAMPRDAETEPVPTITTTGAIHLIDAQAFVLPRDGSQRGKFSNPAYDADDRPFHTVTAQNHDGRLVSPFLVQYNGTPEHSAKRIDEPLPTLSTRARFALCDPEVYPYGIDLRYRMLDPPETKRAQGFPEDYELTPSNKGDRRTLIGNAVPVGMATALCEHILAAETASLSTFGGGLSEEDVEIPPYEQVVADGGEGQ
ncbi:DNA cytosine methyltransferase [Haloplanus rallus]|uniref:DNA (cytosine-5-)-methyltransferase n=1 Tax=Haloplanus rallus TaxID=1816183 RepID=A0A6B9F8N7_9EURY|nr:DNA cytosine methyltransferase [Haloplanus rallus]QGX95942.1 DNA cytosine methyltransferase [Haloplanus rallus]